MADPDPAIACELACPQCTFLNHAENDSCIMCGAQMDSTSTREATAAATSSNAAAPPHDPAQLAASLFNFGLRGAGGEGGADEAEQGGGRRGGRRDRDRGGGEGGRGSGRPPRLDSCSVGSAGEAAPAAAAPSSDRGAGSRGGRERGGGRGGRGGRRGEPDPFDSASSTLDPALVTKGTWSMMKHAAGHSAPSQTALTGTPTAAVTPPATQASNVGSAALASSAPASSSSAAPAATAPLSSAESAVETPDEVATEDACERADQARRERGLYERAADGSVVLRRLPPLPASLAPAAAAVASGSIAPLSSALSVAPESVGFPEYHWRTSGQVSSSSVLRILCVAEKPSIALALAGLLAPAGVAFTTRQGRATPIHEFSHASFRGAPASFRITSVTGHVFGVDFEPGHEDWGADPSALFSARVEKVPERGAVCAQIRDESRGQDALLLWLDCDREGDNIAAEVMELAVEQINAPRAPHFPMHHPPAAVSYPQSAQQRDRALVPGNVLRARFSALTAADVARAMSSLGAPNLLEARAVDARQEIDLRIGVAWTRFQTRALLAKYGSPNLDGARTLSYGPCQTPTFGLVVARDDARRSFKPEPFWSLEVKVRTGGMMQAGPANSAQANEAAVQSATASSPSSDAGSLLSLQWDRGSQIFSQPVAAMYHRLIASHSSAHVVSLSSSERRRARPVPLNTVELLKACSRGLGIGPADTMRHAERLYMAGAISYPRTETSAYHPSFDVREAVTAQVSSELWGDFARGLLASPALSKPHKRGVDAGDHPPITPLRCCTNGELHGDAWKVYEHVTRHFLASVAEDALFEDQSAAMTVGAGPAEAALSSSSISAPAERFTARSTRLLRAGWLEVMPWLLHKDVSASTQPLGFQVDQSVPLVSVELLERQTSPPGPLTESDLIGAMEAHGIGTDASIPMHIKSVQDRGYVTLGAGRTLHPSTLGTVIAHGYQRIDASLVSPAMRSRVESELDGIARGLVPYHAALVHILTLFLRKFRHFVRAFASMEELFDLHFELAGEGKTMRVKQADPRSQERGLSVCGKCKRVMRLHPLPSPPRLHCASCDLVLALPAGGVVKSFHSARCPLDDFELLLFSTRGYGHGERGVSFTFCPYCFNHPPFAAALPELTRGAAMQADIEDAAPPPHPTMTCNQCTHPTCRHSLRARAVAKCTEHSKCGGMLTLDPIGGPDWRLGCNRCNVLLSFVRGAHRVLLLDTHCSAPKCQARLLEVRFHESANPLQGGSVLRACLFCHPLLKPSIQLSFAETEIAGPDHRRGGRGGGGAGRGGRGGRGRGGRGGRREQDD